MEKIICEYCEGNGFVEQKRECESDESMWIENEKHICIDFFDCNWCDCEGWIEVDYY